MTTAKEDIYNRLTKDVISELNVDVDRGLNDDEVAKRREKYGTNSLPQPKGKSMLAIFLSQFLSPLIYVLIGASILSIAAGEYTDSYFIVGIILLNAVLGTWQEWKAENSAAALQSLVKVKARVRRNGKVFGVDAEDLVPGDIVMLESGMKVPADLRLIDVKDLSVEESLLTGESLAVSKVSDQVEKTGLALGDQVNMAFAATTVVRGRGTGITVYTAKETEIGKISESLSQSKQERPPLLNRMDLFSKKISIAVLAVCVILGLVGWYRGMPMMEIVFYMIAAGVAAIPEGLPVALTVALSIGTRRMAKRHVIVRKLPAVEGLGSCTLIASDKTGTLTMDQQSVQVLVPTGGGSFEVSGQGYNGDGEIALDGKKVDDLPDELIELIRAAVLSNEGELYLENEKWTHSGDAVDVALLALVFKAGKDYDFFRKDIEIVKSIPYESERKFSGVFYRYDGELRFAMKGALEIINDHISEEDQQFAHEQSEKLAKEGYRVLSFAGGVAEKDDPENLPRLKILGLAGLIDPLRQEAIDSIKQCQNAGISVVMITGDHPSTALSIAQKLGIAETEDQVVTGKALNKIGEDADRLKEELKDKRVCARVSPLQKQLIVESMKSNGHFVAVTGDGANDAPALKIAHIGIAMGGGTDLAKEASSIIITDNNFASIAAGVEEGRFTYNNLRKIIYLLISTGAAEILMVAVPLFVGLPLPFIAVQLLWLNLVTNGIQDISLAFEKGDVNVMKHPPRDPKESIFDRLMIQQLLLSGTVMSIITLSVWTWLVNQPDFDQTHARSVIMMLMVLLQNFHVLNCRSEFRSIFRLPFKNNYFVIAGIALAQLLHISAAYIPGLRDVLQLEPLYFNEWLMLVPIASLILFAMEIFKIFIRRKEREMYGEDAVERPGED